MIVCIFSLLTMFSLFADGVDLQPLKVFGTAWSGFAYPENLDGLNEESVVYCVGCCDDIAHDVQLCGELGCVVHLFDPTPVAIDHYDLLVGVLNKTRSPSEYILGKRRSDRFCPVLLNNHHQFNYWSIIEKSNAKPENLKYHPIGLSVFDGITTFYFDNVSEQAFLNNDHCRWSEIPFNAPVRKLSSIMQALNHDHIDLLKIDIEGEECAVLNQMLDEGIFPKYLSIDFDLGWTVFGGRDREACYAVIQRLKDSGYHQISGKLPDVTFVLDSKDI